jgi:4-amino-4-deoxy-L-arabinose transferase-like glycosyltransferase
MNIGNSKLLFIIPFILFLISFFIYVFKLGQIPSGFHMDEVALSVFSLKIATGEINTLIGVGQHNHPILSFIPQAIFIKLFGQNVLAARLPSAIISALAIPIYYLFIKYLFDAKTALISSILFLTSHLWIAISRLAINNSQIVFFELLTFYLLFLALQKKKLFYFFLTGLGCGMMLYLYAGYRIVPFLVISTMIFSAISDSNRKNYFYGFLLLLFGVIIISFPQINYFYQHPYAFTSRENDIYIFKNSPESVQWRKDNFSNKNNFQILLTQLSETFMISANAHDMSGQYGYPKKVFDPISMTLILFGLIYCAWYIKKIKYFFLILWFFFTLLVGNVLTIEPFFLPRATGVLPVIFIFSGLLLTKTSELYRGKLKILKVSIWILIIIIMISIIKINLKIYFVDSEKQMFGDPNKYTATKIAYYLQPFGDDYRVVFLTAPNLYSGYTSFISKYQKGYLDVDYPQEYIPRKNNKTIYVLYPYYEYLLSLIKEANPQGKEIVFYDNLKRVQFIIYKID